MKKEDPENSHQRTDAAENTDQKRDAQKNTMSDTGKNQKKDIAHQTGLGRDRIIDMEDSAGMSGRDDYSGGDSDNRSNQNTNPSTDS